MDYQEAKIIADAMDSGMSTLTDWSLANDYGKSRSFHRYAFMILEPVLLN